MIENMRLKGLYKNKLQETHHHLETINYVHNIVLEMCKDSDKYSCLFSSDYLLVKYFMPIRREQEKRLTYSTLTNHKTVTDSFSPYLPVKANEYHKNTIYKYMLMMHYGMHIPEIHHKWLRASTVLSDLLKESLEAIEPINNGETIEGFRGVFTEMILERSLTLFAVSGIHLQVRQRTDNIAPVKI